MIVLVALLGLGAVDARLQEQVDRVARSSPGVEAIVLMDVATGGVLASAGRVEASLPPGSTFKLVTALAALHTRPEALVGEVRCTGRQRVGDSTIECWERRGHGALDLEAAIEKSCNVYFAEVGERVGTAALLGEARALGMGLDPGVLPSLSAHAAELADGQGVRVTAIQEARLLRALATGRSTEGRPLADAAGLARLRSGMRASVERGTAQPASRSPVPVAGKTGTGPLGGWFVGWFVGYAPVDAPTVVVVIAERGARGHDVAARVPALLETFFRGASRR